MAPSFRVFDLPYLCRRYSYPGLPPRPAARVLLPVLAVRTADGMVLVPDEPLSWGQNLARNGRPSFEIRRRQNTVGRLHEFVQTVAPDQILRPGVMDLLVWEYLRSRIATPVDPGARQFEHWQPVKLEVVQTEFRDLVDFGRYCAFYTGPASAMGTAFKAGGDIWIKADRSLPPDRLLGHLEAQRARWHALLGDDRPAAPGILKKLAATLRKSSSDTALSIDQVDSLIDRELNPVFKALWLELAYLGPRVSEPLNHWRCDVLDASHSEALFNAPVVGPLVIFADPVKSTYTGTLAEGSAIKTRKQVLKNAYGLAPRPDVADRKQRAGWKGMAVFNPRLMISHGTWTCAYRAAEFAVLHAELMDLHSSLRTDNMHPYLYINARSARYIGEPLKIGNVEEAFKRACLRAGIKPHTPGASLHGLRHYYRWYAKRHLGLDDEVVQLMLRHKNVNSQKVYGKRAQDVYDAMARLHRERGEV